MSQNVFTTMSPVAAGSRFASPWVKGSIAGLAVVGLFGGYMLLRDNVQTLASPGASAPSEPTPQISHQIAPFTPMPPAVAVAPSQPQSRPTAKPLFTNTFSPTSNSGVTRNMMAYDAGASGRGSAARVTAVQDRPDSGSAAAKHKPAEKDNLAASVTPTKFTPTSVTELSDPDYLIEEGRHIPCTQMTVINTTYAGAVSALVSLPIRGETGDVELLGAGAKLFGTVQHGISNGAARAFVLWQDITTPLVRDRYGVPHQFRIAVNSPASDELGQTGLDGDVNRHLLPKIGAVIGVSALQGASQGLANSMMSNGTNNNSFNMNFGAMQGGTDSAANMLAQQFVNIPDILTRLQGKACEVELVRDLDLSAAYPELRTILEIQRRQR